MSLPSTSSPFRQSLGAISLACGAWFIFCICDAITKWLTASIPVIQVAGINSLIGMVLSGGWIWFRHGWNGFISPRWKLQVLRGVSLAIAGYLVFNALARIPLADFYGIIFLTPMTTTLLAVFFLKEKIGWHRIVSIIIGFCGVIIIAGPSFHESNSGYLYALCAIFFTSSNAVIVRKIGPESVKTRFAFYPFAIIAALFMPLSFLDFHWPYTLEEAGWSGVMPFLSLAGIVLVSTAFAKARDTAVITPFHYSQMIWGAILGFAIFGDVPAMTTLTGSLVIVAAGLMVIWREHVHHTQIATRSPELPV